MGFNLAFKGLTIADVGKAVILTNSECVFVASVVGRAKRMCRVTFTSVASHAVQIFSTLSLKRHDFWEKCY
jgi:hypothetical protein